MTLTKQITCWFIIQYLALVVVCLLYRDPARALYWFGAALISTATVLL